MTENSFFMKNRKRLLKSFDNEFVAFVFSSGRVRRNGDVYYPFRQDSNFFYLTALDLPDSFLLLSNSNSQYLEKIFLRKRTEKEIDFDGKYDLESISEMSGIDCVEVIDSEGFNFNNYLNEKQRIYLIDSRENDSTFLNPFYKYIKSKLNTKMIDNNHLINVLNLLRIKKSEYEISIIQKAIDITKQGILQAIRMLGSIHSEAELHGVIFKSFLKNGADDFAFEPIVASGKNSCILHYISNKDIFSDNELVLFDVGAEYSNYAGDISRTVPASGRFSKRQKLVYQSVLNVFYKVRNEIKPGISLDSLNEICFSFLKEELIQLKLISKSGAQFSEVRSFMPHGVSHFLGLDVHDVGDKSTILEEGMVISCEPGIYIKNEGIGVRIENDILLTKNACIDLVGDFLLEAEDIENYMNSDF